MMFAIHNKIIKPTHCWLSNAFSLYVMTNGHDTAINNLGWLLSSLLCVEDKHSSSYINAAHPNSSHTLTLHKPPYKCMYLFFTNLMPLGLESSHLLTRNFAAQRNLVKDNV
jgi:hypothetical protein